MGKLSLFYAYDMCLCMVCVGGRRKRKRKSRRRKRRKKWKEEGQERAKRRGGERRAEKRISIGMVGGDFSF